MTGPPDIAILLDHFGSGGVERVACHVANGLAARGMRVEMVVLEDRGPARSLLDEAVRVHVLDGVTKAARGYRMWGAVPAIASYLRSRSPALFHSPGNHTMRPAAAAAALARFKQGFVVKVTNPLIGNRASGWQQLWRRLSFAQALSRADLVLVLSQIDVEQVAEVAAALRQRIRVVHNPYISDAMVGSAAGRRPADPPVILSVGRLSRQKNQALLLRAAARLADRPWRLQLCGTGPDEASLRGLAAELGIADRVDFAGFVADLIPYYLAATVTASPSRYEGLPATVLEAIACGCPVVATASSPALTALLRQVGARRAVPLDDEVAFSKALGEALNGRLPAVPPAAALPYGVEASLGEHAAIFAGLMSGANKARANF